jgi:leucyl aminopeptidase (aminopeptidase T)
MVERLKKIEKFADVMINRTFKVKKGDFLVITEDFNSHHDINEAVAKKAYEVGAKVFIIKTAPPETHGKAVDKLVPYEGFTEMMRHADFWLDTCTMCYIYSDAYDRVLEINHDIKYLLISIMDIDMLTEMYVLSSTPNLFKLCESLEQLILKSKMIRVKNPDGTDIEFGIDPMAKIKINAGIADKPGHYSPPAMVNLYPLDNSLNGKLVVYCIYADPWGIIEDPLTLICKDGEIVDVEGPNKEDVNKLKKWFEKYDDNITKVAHVNFGLLPTVKDYEDHGIKNERMWGAMNWGFGHVSAMDKPPHGIPSGNHLDTITPKASVWIDDIQIMENGEFIYGDLKKYADLLLEEVDQ